METAEQFWAATDQSGGPDACWEWKRSIGGHGYGTLKWRDGYRCASRLAWELTHGPVPNDLCVCHYCDNRPCVNPRHLFIGTRAENNADMARKGRVPPRYGQHSARARLTDDDLTAISTRLIAGESQASVALSFGVHPSHVSRIKTGKRWPHRKTTA